MPARWCSRRCVMIRGRAEALQEASGDHHSRQKALAPGGGEGKDLLPANRRLRSWRTISQLFRTNRGQPRPHRPRRSASARPCRLYRQRELRYMQRRVMPRSPRQFAQSLRAGPRRTTPSGRLPPTLDRAVNTAQNGGSGTQVARHQVAGRDGRDGSASLLSSQAMPSFRFGEAAGQFTDVTGAD